MDDSSPEKGSLLETIHYDIRQLNEGLNECSSDCGRMSYPAPNPDWKDAGRLISELDSRFYSLPEPARSDELLVQYEETRRHLLRLRANARTREVTQAQECGSIKAR